VTAKAGDAVLFWDFTPEMKPDPASLHGANPVIKVCPLPPFHLLDQPLYFLFLGTSCFFPFLTLFRVQNGL
jgi:hypothetical protein